ncbi:bromodomain-containing protein 7-like isoform X2 [Portunus trituberculatus]|uniref:bromodomain-containing protein 7-like isoform X2 n=1 Tax=Portunus trituberculatus TaxID=210409 RepID=UPI001E1CDCED|nr:bromodomain-containing protein 7-like isoform X2 [Portunus trituberculatus]
MEKTPLKLKLKLGGSGPATPEQQKGCSPAHPTIISNMADDDTCQPTHGLASDDDGEEEEPVEEVQGEDDHPAEDESSKSRSRHSHHDDGTREKHKKSKKKKKKKEREKDKERHKHRHHRDKTEVFGEDSVMDEQPPPSKKPHLEVIGASGSRSSPTLEPSIINYKDKEANSALMQLLEHLLVLLEKRDPQQFFAWPVTDAIAPGYSSIISQPMDFSAMKTKIQESSYTSLKQFQADFELMCNNCMTYNQPDTIYYKAAKKLLHAGQKMMSPEKVLQLKRDVPLMSLLIKEQLGFEVVPSSMNAAPEGDDTIDTEPLESMDEDGDSKDPHCKFEAVQDNLSAEEVLEQVQGAAIEAAEKLTLKRPSSTLGFLRQRGDGTTSLSFLTGCEGGGDAGSKDKPVSLGLLTGKLTQGSATLHNYREDKRSMAKPIKPVYYGSYSSFCPTYDSTFANLSKDESEMVYATYGNETAVQYAKSIVDFSQDCDMAMHLVDQLLNLLTHQQHTRTKTAITNRRRLEEEEERISALLCPTGELGGQVGTQDQKISSNIDYGALRSLSNLGIDIAFLNHFEDQEKRETQINSQLEENATLLEQLSREQHERLSRPLPASLNNLAVPSQQELQLVEKVTEGLTQVAKQASPGSLAPVPIVRRAMGITVLPVTSEPTDSIEVDIEASWGQDKTTSITTTTTGLLAEPQQQHPTITSLQQEHKTATIITAAHDIESQLSQILHQSEAAPPPPPMAMSDSSLREVLNS